VAFLRRTFQTHPNSEEDNDDGPRCQKDHQQRPIHLQLAPLLEGPEASALAAAARTYANILRDLGITVDTEGFDGCEQAKLLVHWITGESGPTPDAGARMNEWTADIWSAIADLAAGQLPS